MARSLPIVSCLRCFLRSPSKVFLSGFGLAASAYGLPDIGFIGWGDLTTTTSSLRALLPNHHLLVAIDDGFGDATVASHVARTLERSGASGVVLED